MEQAHAVPLTYHATLYWKVLMNAICKLTNQISFFPFEAPMRALAVQGKELMNHATMCNVYKKATSIEMNLISYLGDQIQAGTLNEQ